MKQIKRSILTHEVRYYFFNTKTEQLLEETKVLVGSFRSKKQMEKCIANQLYPNTILIGIKDVKTNRNTYTMPESAFILHAMKDEEKENE